MKSSLGCLARLSAVLVLLGSIAAIPAAPSAVPINNQSFETVNTTYGCTTGSSLNPGTFIATADLGSACHGADPFAGTWSVSGVVGVMAPVGLGLYSVMPDGQNAAFANEGSISQILSSNAGLGTYTLSLFIGGRCDAHPINNYTVELLAGSASIVSDNSTLVPLLATPKGSGCGTFVLDTLTRNVTSSFLGLGQPLKIVLSATNSTPDQYQAAFDKVSLDFQPATTPEPGTLILFGTGLLGLVHRLRRKRFAQS